MNLQELERYLFDTVPFDTPVIVDAETISWDDKSPAYLPYQGHRIAMLGVKWIGHPPAILPLRHAVEYNSSKLMPLEATLNLLREWAQRVEVYWNSNPKFDMRFLIQDGIVFTHSNFKAIDLAMVGRLEHNSHFSYSLEEVAKRENVALKKSALVKTWLDQAKTKDYGKIPLDMLEEYLIGDLDSTEQAIKSLLYKLETRQ